MLLYSHFCELLHLFKRLCISDLKLDALLQHFPLRFPLPLPVLRPIPSIYSSTYHTSSCPLSPLSMTLFLTVSLLLCLSFSLSAKMSISRAAYSHTKSEALFCSNMHEPGYVCVYRASGSILTCNLEV